MGHSSTILISEREANAAPSRATFADRFVLERAVAEGPTSAVWRARELSTNAFVALKFFAPEIVHNPVRLAAARQMIGAMRECRHPGVIAAREIVLAGEHAAIVTPWVEGPTLRQMLYARPKQFFEVDELRRWLRGVIDVFEAAHAFGIVHGALNPDVVLQHAGTMRVVGWGVNAWLHRTLGHGGPEEAVYLSPARRRNELPRASDDIHAIGVLTYHLLAGSPPSSGWLRRRPLALAQQRRKNGLNGGEIPPTWESAIRQCIECGERDRVGSLRELRTQLGLGPPIGSTPSTVPPAPVPAPRPKVETKPASAPSPQRAELPSSEPVQESLPMRDTREAPAVSLLEPARTPGTWALQSLSVMIALVTIGIGGWLVWRVTQRGEFRAIVSELRPDTLLADDPPPPAGEGNPPATEPGLDRSDVVANREPSPGNVATDSTTSDRVLIEEATTPTVVLEQGKAAQPPAVEESDDVTVSSTTDADRAPDEKEPFAMVPQTTTNIAADEGSESVPAADFHPVTALDEDDVDRDLGTALPLVVAPTSELLVSTADREPVNEPELSRADVASQPESIAPPTGEFGDAAPPTMVMDAGETPLPTTSETGAVDRDLVSSVPAAAAATGEPLVPTVDSEAINEPEFSHANLTPQPESITPATGEIGATAPLAIVMNTRETPPLATSEAGAPAVVGDQTLDTGNGAAPPIDSPAATRAKNGGPGANIGSGAPLDDTPVRVRDEPIMGAVIGPPLDGGIFELGDVDVAPRLLERIDPVVPRRRFRSSDRARIELVVVIDRAGRVASASVYQTTDESLVAPSLKAVRLWRFSPATKHGRVVPVRVAVPLNFRTS